MIKFKLSLLLKSAKFKVAIVTLVIAAILAGIIFIPKNKAADLSNQVYVVANKSGVTANGKQYYVVRKSGNATGYDALFCVEQDAELSSKTYSNPINITNAGGYFESYNSAMWLVNNMYTTNIKGGNGLSDQVAKDVLALDLATLLTSDTVKSKVAETGLNVSGITAQKVYSLRNKTLNNSTKENALEFIEQVALWKYTKNTGNTFTRAYADNVNQFLEGTTLTADEQLTLKYTLYALRAVADSKSGTASSQTVTNYVVLKKDNAQVDTTNYKIGPYYMESNGIRLTSYNFGTSANGAFPASATFTKADGTTVKAGTEVFVKNDDGSFYIDISNYKDATKVDFRIDYIISAINTEANVLDGGKKQNILAVNKTVSATSLMDSKTITIPGEYNVVLKKVKKDGTTVITSSEATFTVNGEEKVTSQGVLNVAQAKIIANQNQVDVYNIVETKAPEGFVAANGTAKLTVGFKQGGNKYIVDDTKTSVEGMQGAKVSVSEDKTTVTVFIPNEEKEGTYSVILKKIKPDGSTITSSEATFKVNGKEQKTSQGVLNVAQAKTIANESQNDVYTIEETAAPTGFISVTGTAKLSVKFKLDGKKFIIDKNNTTFETTEGMGVAKVDVSPENSTITVLIPNDEKEGNYNVVLKKVKEDGSTVITSSEATFKVNGEEKTTTQGVLNISQSKGIDDENQTDVYEIEETVAPKGYKSFKGIVKLSVKFKLDGKKYIIDSEKTTIEGVKGAKVEVSKDNTTVTVYIPNEQEPGKYSVELYKTNVNGDIIKIPAKFKVNDKEIATVDGKIQVASDVKVKDEKTVGTYTIKETEAPENYNLYGKTLKLTVKMTKVDDVLTLTEDGIKLAVQGEDEGKPTMLAFSDKPGNAQPRIQLDGTTIKIYVPNTTKKFDLSLRKYISAINGKKVEPSREPVINEESIKQLQQTGTAAYFHSKDSIGVKAGDEVEYTIRVYNEGEILGFAKQITDYLPDGLSFVRLSEDNSKEYTTKTEAGSKVVVIDYSGNTTIKTLRDFFGKDNFKVTGDYYQEVKMICKVENTDKTYITNRGEITNYGYKEKDAEGNTVWKEAKEVGVDRDSVENTIKDNLNLDTWYESAKEYTYKNADGKDVVIKNYYPGTQDDDDFETVELLKGEYNVIIRKVDSADLKTTLEGAYFAINGSGIEKEFEVGPTANNGEVTLIKGVKINSDEQVDEYIIKETKAPYNYALYNGDIVIKIGTKLDNGVFKIDEENISVDKKDVDYKVNENGTTLTIIIPDKKKEFDLSLRKFITEINGEKLAEARDPQVDVSMLANGKAKTATYNHSKTPVDVNTTDVVTYTIRVYNEGEIDGYASKVMDDIPEGLEFVPAEYDQDGKAKNTNAQFGWVLYKEMKSDETAAPENIIKYNNKSYVVTDDVKNADLIVTDYLSMENGKENMMKAYDPSTMKELDYRDVKVSFKVVEPKTSDRVITNYAQITENSDAEGKAIADRDSTPNVWNDGEDDQDTEKVKVRYFDLALRKWVTKAIVYENGNKTVTETNHTPYDNPEPVVKVDLKNTSIDNVEVKFEYSIRVINEGQIEGYAKEISDYIPTGLKFVAADNPEWKEVDGKIVTRQLENTLLKPGEYADVTVVLTWVNGANNLGLKTNIAEISEDYNEWGTPDIDSTPNNQTFGEDDIDDAPVILAIRTGEPIIYTGVAIAALAILSTGALVIKKKILK